MLGISAVPASVAPALAAAGPRTPLSRGPQTCRAPLLWLSPPPCFSIHSSEMPVPKPPASKSATMRPPPPSCPASAPSSLLPPHPFLPSLSLSLSSVSSLLLWVSDLHCPGLLLYSGESLCLPLLLQIDPPS